MKISRNSWEKFVGWSSIINIIALCVVSSKNLMGHGMFYFIRHFMGYYVSAFIFGLPFGSITYGIWHVLIERKKKTARELSKSKWGGVKNELKIIGFSIVGLIICFAIYGRISAIIRSFLK